MIRKNGGAALRINHQMNNFKIKALKKRAFVEHFIYNKLRSNNNKITTFLKKEQRKVATKKEYKDIIFLLDYAIEYDCWVIDVEFINLDSKFCNFFFNYRKEIEDKVLKNDFICHFSMAGISSTSPSFKFFLKSSEISIDVCSKIVIDQIDYANSYYDLWESLAD